MSDSKRLTFVDNMWDGVESIKEKTDLGLKSCKDVLDFFRKLAQIEEEYAKNVSVLLQRYQPSNSNLSLSQGWRGVLAVLEGQASAHKALSVNCTTNLCHPLQALLKDMDARRKQLVQEGAKQRAELRDHQELVKKAKVKYEKSSKDLEVAKNELQAAKPDQIVKLEKNVSAKETDTNTSETQYKLQVQASNNFLDNHQSEKWPYVLNEFEQFEITRISFMKANILNFMGLLKEMPSVLEGEISQGLKASELIDPEADLQTYIDANKTPKELTIPFTFDQYQTGQRPALSGSRPISRIWDNFSLLGSKDEIKPPSLFGVSLPDLMERQQKDEPTLQVPKLVVALCEGIVSFGGLSTEGIFRLAGSASEVQNMRKQLDKGDYSITTNDVHVLASILKQFLRELPEAVIPTNYYDACVNNQITPAELLGKIPAINKTVLLYIVNFLQMVIKPTNLRFNKMNSANLATIFATVLLRSPQKEPSAVLAGLTNEFSFIEKLILTAPHLDVNQFPIFSVLHQTTKELPAVPTSPTTIPSGPTSPAPLSPLSPSLTSPASPSSLASSNVGDVAYSTATDPSCTSFEDMSSKEDQISDFSETDHFDEEGKSISKEDSDKDDKEDKDGKEGKGSHPNEEPNEFVIVPDSDSPRPSDD